MELSPLEANSRSDTQEFTNYTEQYFGHNHRPNLYSRRRFGEQILSPSVGKRNILLGSIDKDST
jgi:hypothetical protein